MDSHIGQLVRWLRRQRGVRQSDLADLAGLKQPNLSRIENGLVAPRRATLVRIAEALGVGLADLTAPSGWESARPLTPAPLTPPPGRRTSLRLRDIPLIETSGAFSVQSFDQGGPTGLVEMILRLPASSGDVFALRVPDESMSAPDGLGGFHAGEVIVFEEQEVHSGEFALARTRELATFRQVIFERQSVRLAPLNRAYAERTLPRSEIENLWKLVGHFREHA
jgi:transcriptional regulator with XRE-family HTH domain